MTNRAVYKIYAPQNAQWTQWAKPTAFVQPFAKNKTTQSRFVVPTVFYIQQISTDTAIFVDLPYCDSIPVAIALAKLGWRPIPLYNGVMPPTQANSTVDNSRLYGGLVWGAKQLQSIDLPNNAPPVFLLDSNRTHQIKVDISLYDNSWDIYAQDLPTVDYFKTHSITKFIVHSNEDIQEDLTRILYNFGQKGMDIFFTDGYIKPEEVWLPKPLVN